MNNKLTVEKLKKILIFIAIILCITMSIKCASALAKNVSLQREIHEKNEELEEALNVNIAYEDLLLPENESTLMEYYAHQNGYAYIDERVYILK